MPTAPDPARPDTIAAVVAVMTARLDGLPPAFASRRTFLDTYRRTTTAVAAAIDGAAIAGAEIESAAFEDPDWVQRWDVVFADLYLRALDADLAGGQAVPRPWRLAFDAPASLPPLRHVLLGINAHINYDLPQALLAVISDEEFADPQLLDRRRRDHQRIDGVLSARVAAEDHELARRSSRGLVDWALAPLNRVASRRLLREARDKVWRNTIELQQARLAGRAAYAVRLAELELLSAARIADLVRPGPVLLRLAAAGFGVVLPPAGGSEVFPPAAT
jgi:Family of unknown function (DUF5995)